MPPIFYDAIILLVLLLFLWHGHHRGFILTLCGFLSLFVALIGASFLSNALAEPVSQLVQPVIEQHLQALFDHAHPSMSEPYSFPEEELLPDFLVEEVPSQQPTPTLPVTLEELLSVLRENKFYTAFSDAIQRALENGQFISGANVIHSVAKYIAFELTSLILFAIFFLLISVVWFLLSHALNLAFRLPVLSTLNQWSGAVLGLLQGAFLVFIACKLLENRFFTQELVQSTILLQYFCNFDPFLFFSRLKFITSSYL